MLRSFREEYGAAVDIPVNAICYEITGGGDSIQNLPESWNALREEVYKITQEYEETKHYTQDFVYRRVDRWISVIEARKWKDIINNACNALTDSINVSGNDPETNMHFVRKLRKEAS